MWFLAVAALAVIVALVVVGFSRKSVRRIADPLAFVETDDVPLDSSRTVELDFHAIRTLKALDFPDAVHTAVSRDGRFVGVVDGRRLRIYARLQINPEPVMVCSYETTADRVYALSEGRFVTLAPPTVYSSKGAFPVDHPTVRSRVVHSGDDCVVWVDEDRIHVLQSNGSKKVIDGVSADAAFVRVSADGGTILTPTAAFILRSGRFVEQRMDIRGLPVISADGRRFLAGGKRYVRW